MNIRSIISNDNYSREEILYCLNSQGDDELALLEAGGRIRKQFVSNKVYLRGLIEYSNICAKNCFYCGIRRENKTVGRYCLSDENVLDAARFAMAKNYGSIVIQSGELSSPDFVKRIEQLIREIKRMSDGNLGITLSLGEQTEETYQKWYDAGAHRYLLRIEASNPTLYKKLHPDDPLHSYETRVNVLQTIKKVGYQTGTGVMIGLPFQTMEDLADDLCFMRDIDIDMCGMGPYVEHKETPLFQYRDQLMSQNDRLSLTLKMIATLRIMMKNINIASTTALQAINKEGRAQGILAGANILMPNITPGKFRDSYLLYENKPSTNEEAEDSTSSLEAIILHAGAEIGYGVWGDSLHYKSKL
ncbi:MAG: [FeFe] hydrogenase H-cluster radical SAM maturase HydE [Bacteroidetes bacterium HGW-Bacteroidetes-21]|jgi:biotin synthase|nr:MAG: [FeFe] hydrogenase H-cluster radical SAM maturase HydE [Bacteroidetes bacterium HGW-Bacteroidetes-21]